MRKGFFTLMCAVLLQACAADGMAGSMHTEFTPQQAADGARTFSLVMHQGRVRAFDGNEDKARDSALSRHMGRTQHCSSGYEVTSRQEVEGGMIYYEGRCR